MKTLTIPLLIFILFINGCKKENPIPIEDPEEKDITAASIGASGGVLKTEALQVTIPAGAFSAMEDIHLTELSDAGVFGPNSRSLRYKIDGLPETYDLPLKITIAYQGTLSGETFVLVGEEGLSLQTGEEEVICEFLPAVDSSGYLIAYIPGIDGELAATNVKKSSIAKIGKKWVSVEAVSDFFSYPVDMYKDTCRLYIPADNKDIYSPMIVDYLDNAQERMNLGIFTGTGALNVNIKSVFIANLAGEDYCRFAWRNGSSDGRMKPRGILAVNINKVDDDDKMRVMVGREVLRSFLFCFDPQYPHMRSPDKIPHHWLDQAVITWSETEFAHELDRADHLPTDFKGNELKPFQGMHAGILQGDESVLQNTKDHGRGMASFIEYLVDYHSSAVILAIYLKIMDAAHPVEAIQWMLENINTDNAKYKFIADWYFFLCEYLEGLHFAVSAETFISSIPAENVFSIDGNEDTIKVFQGTFPDLSAKLYKVDLTDQEFRENGTLEFSLSGVNQDTSLAGIQVFGYTNKLTRLDDKLRFEASELKEYNSLIVMVINLTATSTYTGEIPLEIKVRASRTEVLPFNRCQLEITTKGDYINGLIPPVNPEPNTGTYLFSNIWKTLGSCVGNVYTGNYDPAFHGDQTTGTIKVTFDDSLHISSYELTSAYVTAATDSVIWSIQGSVIKKSFEYGAGIQYEVKGTDVCSVVSSVYYYSEAPDVNTGSRRYNKMTNLVCDENSRLKFTISSW